MSNEPRFEVFQGKSDREHGPPEWYFRIRARNGKIVAASEGYTRDEDAIRGLGDAVYTMLQATGQPDLLSAVGTIPVLVLQPNDSRVTLEVAVTPSGG